MTGKPDDLVVLQGVTLGMAKAEIDFLMCRPRAGEPRVGGGESPPIGHSLEVVLEPSAERKRRSGQSLPPAVLVDAIAMCEVKRDSSDLGCAVSKSSEVMAWLCGEEDRYDPAEWANRFHPLGHFGVGADGRTLTAHASTFNGVTYLFDRQSFAAFRSGGAGGAGGAPSLPPCLHLVTSRRRRAGDIAVVRPLCSRAFGRLQHKACRDVELLRALLDAAAADEYDWQGLCSWLRQTSGPLSAAAALQLFGADPAAANRLHVEVSEVQEGS
jgi:hypothetical protein